MTNLLAWGDALFLLRCELAFALPADARLVAAKEVEDTELAIHYPLLVFHGKQESDHELSLDTSSVARNLGVHTRRYTNHLVDNVSPEGRECLFFCILFDTDSDDVIGLRLLNKLNYLTHDNKAPDGESKAVFGNACNSPQCLISDGPHVLLSERHAQTVMILRLQRGTDGDISGFYVWYTQVDVTHSITSFPPETFQVVSCAYVSRTHASKPHMLIHAQRKIRLSADDDRKSHIWSIVTLDGENNERMGFHGLGFSNTIHVHSNGVLIVSYALPAPPVEMFMWETDVLSQYHVLCLRCDDVDRSFYFLGFSSNAQKSSMDLLLSFKNVGFAYAANFAGIHTGDFSAFRQVLLLNHLSTIVETSSNSTENEAGSDHHVNDWYLIKRSVLVIQKAFAPYAKLCCHRLRLREKKTSMDDTHSRKRSRNDKKSSSSRLTMEPLRCIELIQKPSLRDKLAGQDDKEQCCVSNFLALQSQLNKLVNNLLARLNHGIQLLDRLQKIVGDKEALIHNLILFIAEQWQTQQSGVAYGNLSSFIGSHNSLFDSRSFVDMKIIVDSPLNLVTFTTNTNEAWENVLRFTLEDSKMHIVLQQFRVLQHSPSSSFIYAEVLLRSMAGLELDDSFVVLTAHPGTAVQWYQSSSTIFSKLSSGGEMADQTARFNLKLHFEPKFTFLRQRKPLELTLWLHWGPPQGDHDLRSNVAAVAIAPIRIYPDDVLAAGRELHNGAWDNKSCSKESLLFLSSGSNLVSWSHELMLYEMSRMIAKLPSDVYVMRNPLQISQLRALQRLLRLMRNELKQSPIEHIVSESQAQTSRQEQLISIHRSMQHDTDLQANQVLHKLQKRVNFHTMWFNATDTSN
ncbi:uncharacterized protein PHALS_03927 [Plasmopara halstedii]|uniref:Uncharacterized protein n=1 Tax=Plasmopara halstedii TaxID=4781 RepID=A0A0P1AZH6_PLAHL|nr:uncharacterized protein PHALS_03927 [Plasmopara halstedii]CEG47282.1 hypothetical protein PHALS_03927 [Plasmopara halstedii]|eukprot:XP_024583651.1 hypothetical protein PHALS_03927 [Plasmopara halstedii]